MEQHKVAIIGGGPGGYEAAIRLNQYGIDCVVIEKERIGGVCLNWGCIPTKALVKSAEIWQEVKENAAYGLNATPGELDYSQVYARKNDVVEKLVSGIEYLFRKRKIGIIKAVATSLRKDSELYTITLDNGDTVQAEYVIVATGSTAKILPGISIDEHDILSSTGILRMDKLPRTLAVIGGGVIGCEFASVFNTFGVEVTIIEFLPSLIAMEDEEIAKRLQMAIKKSGIKVKTGVGVTAVAKTEEGLTLTMTDESTLTVDKVLMSVGRVPATNLEWDTAPEMTKGAININASMQTSLPQVYAIGDVTGKLQLAHTASKQGFIAAESIRSALGMGELHSEELIYENIPRCIFTFPEVSSCGLTEQQAKDKYGEILVGRFPFTANGKAMAGGNTFGFVKTIAKADDQTLVGMHIIGPQAAELIAQGSILINLKAKAKDFESVVIAHPTLSEAIMESIEDLNGLSIHKI